MRYTPFTRQSLGKGVYIVIGLGKLVVDKKIKKLKKLKRNLEVHSSIK